MGWAWMPAYSGPDRGFTDLDCLWSPASLRVLDRYIRRSDYLTSSPVAVLPMSIGMAVSVRPASVSSVVSTHAEQTP